jgi:hypothetical protein
MSTARAPPSLRYPHARASAPGQVGLLTPCDSADVSDPSPARRRDPAWFWYALAVGALALVAILDAAGVLDRLGP